MSARSGGDWRHADVSVADVVLLAPDTDVLVCRRGVSYLYGVVLRDFLSLGSSLIFTVYLYGALPSEVFTGVFSYIYSLFIWIWM